MKRLLPLVALGAILALSLAAVTLVILPISAAPGVTAVNNDNAGATAIGQAALANPALLTGATFVAAPPSGTPNGYGDAPLSFFPRDGSTFGILTSGDVNLANTANSSSSSGAGDGGGNVRGNSDFDVTILRLDIDVPSGNNCLALDFAFYSEEYPEFVGGSYNDAFIAELDSSTWSTSGSAITAPDNFAFDDLGNVISINSTGATSMSAANAAGTTYDGATIPLSAKTPIAPGAHSLYLSIFDQGDSGYDSAAFFDNVRVGFVNNPAKDCQSGSVPAAPLPQVLGALGVSGHTATLQAGGQVRWVCDPNNPDVLVTIRFSYDWGTQDINGTGRISLTQVPPTNVLNSVQCIVNSVPGPTLMIDWFEPLGPSGVVTDSTSGLPVLGATVMLRIEDPPNSGIYRDVDPIYDAALIEPDINPETTDLLGRYAWTAGPGNYRVVVNPGICGVCEFSGSSLIAGSAAALCAESPPTDGVDPNVYIDCLNHDTDSLPDFAELITESDSYNSDSASFGCLPFPPLPCFTGFAGGNLDNAENPDGDAYNNYQEIQLGRNPLVNENADDDGDGCPNGKELQTAAGSQTSGGRRDPYNPYDYFEPTHNHQNRIDDVLKVVHQFFIDSGNLAYNADTDRTYVGPNPWNLGPPNGQQRVDDILHSVHQFFQDCA